jgi:membrane AbrB-like protein
MTHPLRGVPIGVFVGAAVGALGATAANALHFPAPFLTGPALAAVAASLLGAPIHVPETLRNASFLVIGVGMGGGVTPAVIQTAAHWPLSLVLLAATLVAIQLWGARLLRRRFGYDAETATLAACPGHMSFVIGLSAEGGADIRKVTLAHSVRVLLLTLGTPFLAVALWGVEVETGPAPGTDVALPVFAVTAAAALALGLWMKARGAPAALLLGGLIVSGGGNASGLIAGGAPEALLTPAFVVMGVFVGSRFGGVRITALARELAAGAALTLLACVAAGAAAFIGGAAFGLPAGHLFVAFAPGGLEAMAAMALMLGIDPAFVAAHHMFRLAVLAGLTPILLARVRRGSVRDKG